MSCINFRSIRFGALAVTLILLAVSFLIPPKQLQLHPMPTTALYPYSGDSVQGNSANRWQSPQNFSAHCTLKSSDAPKVCGIALTFFDQNKARQASVYPGDTEGITGLDLSRFNGLEVEFEYQGAAQRIRLVMRNVEFNLKKTEELPKAKQMEAYIERDEFGSPTFIDFTLLNVSNWWISENNIRRENTRPAFNNIMEVLLHFPANTPLGSHVITVKRITAKGDWINRYELYRYLIIFLVLLILTEAVWHALKMRREKDEISASLLALKSDYELLKNSAELDPLTQRLNRRGIDAHALALLNAEPVMHYWVSIFQIDDFKQFVDAYGQAAADVLLKDLARMLGPLLNTGDELGRWSADNFILFSAGGNRQDIFNHCEKLRKSVSSYTFRCHGRPLPLMTISIGITRLIHNESFGYSLDKADKALQSAKANGRNQTAVSAY